MELIINGTAVSRSSLGARRYLEAVLTNLDWPGTIRVDTLPLGSRFVRIREMIERGNRQAIYWSPCHRGPLFAYNHVVTVLDCINIEYVYKNDWRLPILRTVFGRLLDNARAVVCISNATRAAVLRNFAIDPGKIIVIPGPVDITATSDGNAEVKYLSPDRDDFVLMVSNSLPHKNTRRAVASFAASSAARRKIGLRVVGSVDPAALAAAAGWHGCIEQHRDVPDTILHEWLAQCRFLWSPSLDEGLNLPIAEALAAGTDVLCSDIPVHHEFYEGEVAFFDPTEQHIMVEALEAAFERKPGWYPRIVRKQPTSQGVGSAYSTLFQDIAATLTQ